MKIIVKLLRRYNEVCKKLTGVAQLLSRVVIGWLFIESGWGKLHHLDHVVEFFTSLNIPFPQIQAPFVASMELLCGALVLFGFLTRLASFFLICILAVALLTAKRDDISDFDSLISIYEFVYILVLTWLMTVGPGKTSIDRA